jgi:hypothetical protein
MPNMAFTCANAASDWTFNHERFAAYLKREGSVVSIYRKLALDRRAPRRCLAQIESFVVFDWEMKLLEQLLSFSDDEEL